MSPNPSDSNSLTLPDTTAVILAAISDVGVRGLVATIERLALEGELLEGARLPSIRQLADVLAISPTTVATAWSHLSQLGIVESFGRKGSYIAPRHDSQRKVRRWQFYEDLSTYKIDLATGVPDPTLLPDPLAALGEMSPTRTTSYLDPPVYPPLRDAIAELVPAYLVSNDYAMTVVDGALEGLDRLLGVLPPYPRAIAVEEPSFPALYDLIEAHGYQIVSLELDDEGVTPASLVRALARGDLVAVLIQPRAQNPTGISLTRQRRDDLALLLAQHPGVFVIEDDHSGLLCASPLNSLGEVLGGTRVGYILSFSKSHGPDLRLATIFTNPDRIAAIEQRRALGPSWSSKLLQAALTEMLRTHRFRDQLDAAISTYQERRQTLTHLFGTTRTHGEGINLWLKTPDELALLVHLAHEKIRVAPGANFYVSATERQSTLRVTLGDPWTPFSEVTKELEVSLAKLGTIGSYR
ncbi:MAG: aminotransferase-like domain-containing protein [Ferrimicrobium sp.]